MKFTVPGRCVPAPRMTRFGRRSPRVMKYMEYREAVAWAAKSAGVKPIPKGQPVEVEITICMNQRGNYGDLDNYQKTILDALNGIAWADDRQVEVITASRLWVKGEEKTVVSVEQMDPDQRGQKSHPLKRRAQYGECIESTEDWDIRGRRHRDGTRI